MPVHILDCLQDSFEPLSNQDIDWAERQLGVRLPAEYRAFLLRFNGGYFRGWVMFQLLNPKRFITGGTADSMSAILEGSDYGSVNLVRDARTIEGLFEYDMLPIGRSGGQAICLCTARDNYGSIYLADSDAEPEDGEEKFHFVAPDILAFVNLLAIDPEFEKHEETLPVFQAVERGDLDPVREYLAGGGIVDAQNASGHTLLMCSARNRWPKIAALLLEHGAATQAIDGDGRTALHFAAERYSLDLGKLLLAAGTPVNARDAAGQTPLRVATDALAYRLANFLSAAGAEK